MQPSSPLFRAVLAVAALLALVALLAVVAGGALGRGVDPSPAPSQTPSRPPSAAPSIPASPQPSVEPTADPSADPSDRIHVDLANLTDHDVSIVIDDETGTVADARSGQPGDGMSVRWLDVEVENLDDSTLRITWVGLPRNEEIRLAIAGDDGSYALDFFQAAPPPYSDAVGYDRILVLTFDTPVSADDVTVTVHEPVIPA